MIGIFLGEQNSGKTLAMTYYAMLYQKRGYEVYSNYNLGFEHKKITKKVIVDYVKNKKQFIRAVFCIDEIYLILDSRNFGQKSSKIFSYFLLQTSKRNVHLLGTAQYFNTVEKRFRENCNFRVFCSRVIKKDNKYYDVSTNLRFLKDTKNLFIAMNFIIRKSLDGITDSFIAKRFHLQAEPMFKYYDTTELLGIEE